MDFVLILPGIEMVHLDEILTKHWQSFYHNISIWFQFFLLHWYSFYICTRNCIFEITNVTTYISIVHLTYVLFHVLGKYSHVDIRLLTLWLLNIAMEAMAHRNRWVSQRTKPPFIVWIFQFAIFKKSDGTIKNHQHDSCWYPLVN